MMTCLRCCEVCQFWPCPVHTVGLIHGVDSVYSVQDQHLGLQLKHSAHMLGDRLTMATYSSFVSPDINWMIGLPGPTGCHKDHSPLQTKWFTMR